MVRPQRNILAGSDSGLSTHYGNEARLPRPLRFLTQDEGATGRLPAKCKKDGKHVTTEDIERARQHGATDKEIHDTVLIAAAFCMFNRYVDGLGHLAADRSRDLPRNRKADLPTRLRGPGLQKTVAGNRRETKQSINSKGISAPNTPACALPVMQPNGCI